jgi:hypothetical protein
MKIIKSIVPLYHSTVTKLDACSNFLLRLNKRGIGAGNEETPKNEEKLKNEELHRDGSVPINRRKRMRSGN